MSNCKECPKICHDKKACVEECGCKKCGCVRNTDCDKVNECKERGPRMFPCELPCDPNEVMNTLKVHIAGVEHDCRPWATHSGVYDPLKAFHKCAKPPCLHGLPPCGEACPARCCQGCQPSCTSSSKSSVCECHVNPGYKICPNCKSSSSTTSSTTSSSH
jgi:hypothetical protein